MLNFTFILVNVNEDSDVISLHSAHQAVIGTENAKIIVHADGECPLVEEAAVPSLEKIFGLIDSVNELDDGNVIGTTVNEPEDCEECKILIFVINSQYYYGIPRFWLCKRNISF